MHILFVVPDKKQKIELGVLYRISRFSSRLLGARLCCHLAGHTPVNLWLQPEPILCVKSYKFIIKKILLNNF